MRVGMLRYLIRKINSENFYTIFWVSLAITFLVIALIHTFVK